MSKLGLGLAFCLAVSNAQANQTHSAATHETHTQLHADLAAIRTEHKIPVLGYSVFNHYQAPSITVLGATVATPMRWGSNTKTITALTVLQLAKVGLINLDAPLSRYVDAKYWHNPWRKTHPIRVIHLLELTAGFTDLSAIEFNYAQPLSLSDALALAPDYRTTRWPPGLQHSYSNLAPGLTQLLIETTTGLSYSAAAKQYVLKPLQMLNTDFSPAANLPGGFKADGITPIAYWHMTFPAYGAMNAPISDITQLAQSLLGHSRVLGKQTIDHLLISRSSASARAGFAFDYASGFYPRVRRGLVWHGHGGDADGYRSRVALLPEHNRGYVVAINTDNPKALRRIEQRLEAHISNQVATPLEPQTIKLSRDSLSALTGSYYPASTRFGLSRWIKGQASGAQITLHKDGKTLLFTANNRGTQLIPVSANTFRRPDDPVATIAFVRQGSHQFLQGELGNFFRKDHCPEYTIGVLSGCEKAMRRHKKPLAH